MTRTDTVSARAGDATLPARRAFRADVQGLRAIAVGLVLLYHAGVPFITGGYIGVDVFFVISGFLISSHLLESLERRGRIDFADFYARRIRRILPASLTVAVLTALAAVLFTPPLALERVIRDALATVLYVPNVWFAIQETDYLADHSPSPYQHYWSLGVEEQFYLLWPVLLLGLFLLVRRRRALLVGGMAALAALSLAAGVWLTPVNQPVAFFSLPTRAWELLVGAVVGAVLLHGPTRLPGWLAALGGWSGIGMIVAGAVLYDDRTAFPGTAAVLPVIGTALVILLGAQGAGGGPGRVLGLRPMQFIGLISYSLYLVHWPLLVVTQAAVGEEEPLRLWVRVLLGIVLAVPLAWLLFRFVETPLRAPRALTARRPRVTLWSTLAITAVLATTLAGTAQWAGTRSIDSGQAAVAAPDVPQAPPPVTTAVPDNMRPSLRTVADDASPVHADGCQNDPQRETVQDCVYGDPDGARRVAVFGDSHSAQWVPTLQAYAAETGDVRIESYTKSSCPAVEATVLIKGVPYASCDRWRTAVRDHLIADPPELVVISSLSHYGLAGVDDEATRRERWAAGAQTMVRELEQAGAEVLVIADTPQFDTTPATCASADVADVSGCAVPRDEGLDLPLQAAERGGVEAAGGRWVDLGDYICDPSSCPVIIGDIFVYHDVNHLTATFAAYLTPVLRGPLDELLGIPASPSP